MGLKTSKPAVTVIITMILVAGAAASAPNEYQIKAAFLYNFANFVEWPQEAFADSNTPIVVGVIGEDPFGEHLDQTLKGKTANGRKLTVKRFNNTHGINSCHILFVSSSEKRRLSRIFNVLKGASTMTVGETERFTERGGVTNFVYKDNKITFEINMENAKKAKLKISSKLLKLAKIVKD